MIKTTKKLKNGAPKTEVAKPENDKVVTAKPSTAKAAVIEPITPPKPVVAATPVTVKPAAPAPVQPKPTPAPKVHLELVKPEAKSVAVAGSFNEWKPERTPLVPLGNGQWKGDLDVKPGRHEYLFVVDGQWLPDPNAKESVANPFGGKNSVLIVSE